MGGGQKGGVDWLWHISTMCELSESAVWLHNLAITLSLALCAQDESMLFSYRDSGIGRFRHET